MLTNPVIQRGNVLREKGDDPQLLARLLEDGQKWIDLRDMLQSQVDEAKRFGVDYSNRHDESGLEDLLRLIDSFSNNVSQKLSQLDGLSKDLIQMVSIVANLAKSNWLIISRNSIWSRSTRPVDQRVPRLV